MGVSWVRGDREAGVGWGCSSVKMRGFLRRGSRVGRRAERSPAAIGVIDEGMGELRWRRGGTLL
jgi:hypothetical protein